MRKRGTQAIRESLPLGEGPRVSAGNNGVLRGNGREYGKGIIRRGVDKVKGNNKECTNIQELCTGKF